MRYDYNSNITGTPARMYTPDGSTRTTMLGDILAPDMGVGPVLGRSVGGWWDTIGSLINTGLSVYDRVAGNETVPSTPRVPYQPASSGISTGVLVAGAAILVLLLTQKGGRR